MSTPENVVYLPPPDEEAARNRHGLQNTTSLRDLMGQNYLPRQFLVHDFVPERSIGVLAGRPQAGKTPLLQKWALSIVRGERWAEQASASKQAEVLWLGLERGPEVLQHQFRAMLRDKEWRDTEPPDGLHVAWGWPRLGVGGEKYLCEFLLGRPLVKLVCVDPWPLFKPNMNRREGVLMYEDDYADISILREFVLEFGVGFELILHANQSRDPVDMMAAIYGNTGFVGVVDVRRLLTKGKTDMGKLELGGTLVQPKTERLVFEYPHWRFKTNGDGGGEEEEDTASRDKTAFDALLKFGPGGARRGEWEAEAGLPKSTFNRALTALVDANWVAQPQGRGKPYVALTERD